MADLVLVSGEFGFNVDFNVFEDGALKDLTDFDTNVLLINSTAFAFSKNHALTKPGDLGVLRWAVASGEVPTTATMYLGQLVLTDTATQVRKTVHLDIRVVTGLASS